MMVGTISTAVIAGVIMFFFMLGVKRIISNYRNGICCGSGGGASGCGGGCSSCGCHAKEQKNENAA